jgi:hypothetical protein
MIDLPHGFVLETMPVPRGFTLAGFAEDQRERLRVAWREKGELFFTAWIDGQVPMGGGARRLMVIMPKAVVDGTTAIASQIVRRLVKATNAAAVLITMEAWFAELEDPKNEGAAAARAKLPKSLQDYDQRKECLWMALEQRGVDQQAWRAQIHRNPDRVDPFVPFNLPMQGKLVSWFAEGVG